MKSGNSFSTLRLFSFAGMTSWWLTGIGGADHDGDLQVKTMADQRGSFSFLLLLLILLSSLLDGLFLWRGWSPRPCGLGLGILPCRCHLCPPFKLCRGIAAFAEHLPLHVGSFRGSPQVRVRHLLLSCNYGAPCLLPRRESGSEWGSCGRDQTPRSFVGSWDFFLSCRIGCWVAFSGCQKKRVSCDFNPHGRFLLRESLIW